MSQKTAERDKRRAARGINALADISGGRSGAAPSRHGRHESEKLFLREGIL